MRTPESVRIKSECFLEGAHSCVRVTAIAPRREKHTMACACKASRPLAWDIVAPRCHHTADATKAGRRRACAAVRYPGQGGDTVFVRVSVSTCHPGLGDYEAKDEGAAGVDERALKKSEAAPVQHAVGHRHQPVAWRHGTE